jgi:hypothetical protein
MGWLLVWSIYGGFALSVLLVMAIAMNGHPWVLLVLIPLAAACCMGANAAMNWMVS